MRVNLGRLVGAVAVSLALAGCGSDDHPGTDVHQAETVGAVGLDLQVAPGLQLTSFAYSITGPGSFTRAATIDLTGATALATIISPLPAGTGFSISISATSTDEMTTCGGSAPFSVTAGKTSTVTVSLQCHEAPRTGSLLVNGSLNVCPIIDGIAANPSEVFVGGTSALTGAAHDVDLAPSALAYQWTASSGVFDNALLAAPTFTCLSAGPATITLTVSDGDCTSTLSATVTCTAVPSADAGSSNEGNDG